MVVCPGRQSPFATMLPLSDFRFRYPPTAPVPVALSDATLPVSHYFPDSHSNGRMVNLSVWINPSAAEKLAHEIPHDKDAPVFTYTPIVRTEVDRASLLDPLFPKSFDTPPLPPLPATIPLAKSSCSRYRARSSTAPAATLSRTGTPQLHAFGSRSRSLGSAKSSSPLAPVQAIPSSQRGLGISERPLLRVDRQRESVSDVSEDFEPVPSLNFSQLSLSIDTPDTHTLNTPITNAVDWLCPDAPDEHGRTTSAFDASLKASSLGPIWHRGSGRISK